ncbi:O-antigen polymerase [Chryseobacterium sp.]|uniref:O-antigen polymerase n=1 Tax=Chryseobacterium sp. TaxID=1871047 RepID=UPI00289E2F2E|nr:O-antigen polymerase [Chryseobacterium sp.]
MNLFFIICISIFCGIISYDGSVHFFSTRVYLTSLVIQIFSLTQIFNDKYKNFSLYKIFYLFTLFFLGIAPVLQYYKKEPFFEAPLITEEWYFYTNVIIIIICFSYTFFYNFFYKLKKFDHLNFNRYEIPKQLSPGKSFLLIVLSIISFLAVLYANNFSILSMLVRGGTLKKELSTESTSVNLIIAQFIRPISFLCFLFYISTSKKNYFVTAVLLIIALVTCSPFGIARFYAAAIYLPLLLIVFDFFRKKNIFSASLILGLLFVFPALNYFRDFTKLSKIKFGLDFEMFNSGHFDSFQNFSLIVSHSDITWGRQLLGVIFFWVPRVFWPNKPEGSGTYLAKQLRFSFDNISANFFAEGYVNFGIFGIFLFTVIISYVTAYADKLYWNQFHNKRNFIKIAYFITLGMFFFMLRGDLLSSFAYTMGFLLSFYTIYKLLKI